MKKYKELYEEEKERHEEALQRYQEDYADEMEIIKLHKKWNKKGRKVLQHKALSKSDESPINDPGGEEKKPKKVDGKKSPKSPEFIDSSEEFEGEGPPKDDTPLLGMKEEAQSFLDLQKESKTLAIKKKVEEAVFMARPYKGYELPYVALCDTKYLKWLLKMSDLKKKTKDLIKQVLAKT